MFRKLSCRLTFINSNIMNIIFKHYYFPNFMSPKIYCVLYQNYSFEVMICNLYLSYTEKRYFIGS